MRPTREEMLMAHAQVAAMRSTCSRAAVGCVFAYEGRVLVTGYNGAPRSLPHCDHDCDCVPMDVTDAQGKGRTEHRPSCNFMQPCTTAVHAEANAIAFASRHGVRLEGSDLYTTYTPCLACAQLIINVGVERLYAGHAYRDNRGVQLLRSVGIEVVDLAISERYDLG